MACTAAADLSGIYEKALHAAVVLKPATSILSLTAKGTPQRGGLSAAGHDSSSLQAFKQSVKKVVFLVVASLIHA